MNEENFYYIDETGFIEFAGKFKSNEEADQFLEDKQISQWFLFSETYLKDFIQTAQVKINGANK